MAEDTLQSELNIVTQQVFANALAKLDLETIVGKAWVTLEMDAALDAAVNRAVERVKSETDLWNKFLSGWSPDKAKELTLAVATYTFDDPAFRTQMDALSAAVAENVAERLALASADSVSSALYCLQTFIGRNYSKALVSAFEERMQQATTGASLLDAAAVSPDILAIVGEHELALGGVGVIIAAQITKKIVTSIAQRISQRVAGRIVGRVLGRAGSTIIPIAGWLIGTGMIVYDLYDSRDGALPQIQESIKGDAVAAGMRTEIAAAIRPELEAELPGLARTIANDLYAEWRNTKRNIRQVIDLAARTRPLPSILGAMETPEQVAQLVALVTLLRKAGGEEGLAAAIADGTLQKAASLPVGALTIAQETGSIADGAGLVQCRGRPHRRSGGAGDSQARHASKHRPGATGQAAGAQGQDGGGAPDPAATGCPGGAALHRHGEPGGAGQPAFARRVGVAGSRAADSWSRRRATSSWRAC